MSLTSISSYFALPKSTKTFEIRSSYTDFSRKKRQGQSLALFFSFISFVKLTSTPPQLDVELTTSKHQVWKLLILNAILFLFIHLYAPAGTGEIYE